MATWRTLLAILLSALPPLFSQGEQVVSQTDGNFELQGTVGAASKTPVALRFRAKSGLGYRIAFSGPAMGSLDDPGRRSGILASPALPLAKEIAFRLIANGPRIQLEANGKSVWDYTEKEAGVASSGTVSITGIARNLAFRPLPPTPPTFAERYGPALGERAPAITAPDQTGKPRDFASLRGPKGLWILFIRSADW